MKFLKTLGIITMVLLMPCFAFVACDGSTPPPATPTTLTQAKAQQVITNARNNMSTKDTYEMLMMVESQKVKHYAYTPTQGYLYTLFLSEIECWAIEEDGVMYQYTIENQTTYTKALADTSDTEDDGEGWHEYEPSETMEFVSAEELSGTTTIIYQFYDEDFDKNMIVTYKIKNNVIISINQTNEQGAIYVTVAYKYGAEVQVPALPTKMPNGSPIIWA